MRSRKRSERKEVFFSSEYNIYILYCNVAVREEKEQKKKNNEASVVLYMRAHSPLSLSPLPAAAARHRSPVRRGGFSPPHPPPTDSLTIPLLSDCLARHSSPLPPVPSSFSEESAAAATAYPQYTGPGRPGVGRGVARARSMVCFGFVRSPAPSGGEAVRPMAANQTWPSRAAAAARAPHTRSCEYRRVPGARPSDDRAIFASVLSIAPVRCFSPPFSPI